MGRGAFKGAVQIDNVNDTVDVSSDDARDLGDVEVTDGAGTVVDPRDVTDRTGRDLGKARLMDESGVLVDYGPFHDRVTATGTWATINPGVGGGAGATIVADTSGAATLTVEVSNDGASWSAYTVSIGGSEGAKETVRGFAHVRAQADQNLNSLELSARGI